MTIQEPSFKSSWHLLTKEKGWLKPLVILTLVGWIPIIGQMAVLGYAFEWARRTAWGMEASPKQKNVNTGKLLTTGGICFLLLVCIGLIILVINDLLFNGHLSMAWAPTGMIYESISINSAGDITLPWILLEVINLLFGVFLMCAMMRATIYDSFVAGWRWDRLFQMIGRDVKGFFKAFLVSLIASICTTVYWVIAALIGSLVGFGFVLLGVVGSGGAGYLDSAEDTINYIFSSNAVAGLVVFIIVAAILVIFFVGGIVANAMQLIAVNGVGQWFSKFEVNRWGKSADELPAGVPADAQERPETPVAPAEQAAQGSVYEQVQPVAAAQPTAENDGVEEALASLAPEDPQPPVEEEPAVVVEQESAAEEAPFDEEPQPPLEEEPAEEASASEGEQAAEEPLAAQEDDPAPVEEDPTPINDSEK